MGENWCASRKTGPRCTFSVIKSNLDYPGDESRLSSEWVVTNHLSCGTENIEMAMKMWAGEEMWTSCATGKYDWLLGILGTHLKFWGETSLGWPTLRSEVSHRFWLYTFLLNSYGATPRHWRQLLWVGTTSPGSTLRCRSCSRYPITLSRRRSGVRVDLSS